MKVESPLMLNEFIEMIVVYEADKSRGRLNRKQKVDIYFNFVGQIDLSEPVTQEEGTDKLTGEGMVAGFAHVHKI